MESIRPSFCSTAKETPLASLSPAASTSTAAQSLSLLPETRICYRAAIGSHRRYRRPTKGAQQSAKTDPQNQIVQLLASQFMTPPSSVRYSGISSWRASKVFMAPDNSRRRSSCDFPLYAPGRKWRHAQVIANFSSSSKNRSQITRLGHSSNSNFSLTS